MNIYEQPIILKPNRVKRTYTGGLLLDKWLGEDNPADGNYPENWISSTTSAKNDSSVKDSLEGLSVFDFEDGTYTLKDVIEKYPIEMLGAEHVNKFKSSLTILVKMLDSSERLTLQIHPDKKMAKELFNSDYGKLECWYVVDTRVINGEKPYILLGFKNDVNKEIIEKLFIDENYSEMVSSMNKIYIKKGDVFLIKGLMPHAIGEGALILEIQEPTDLTLRLERTTPSGLKIADELCHQGIGYKNMFECINYTKFSENEICENFKISGKVLVDNADYKETILIGYDSTECFEMHLVEINSGYLYSNKNNRFAIVAVLSGKGCTDSETKRELISGSQIFIPANLSEVNFACGECENMTLIFCFPKQF